MIPPFDLAEARRRWLLVAGLCALVGTAEGIGMFAREYRNLTPLEELALHWVHWTVWACLYPVFHWLVRRFPMQRGRRVRSLLAYVVLAPPIFFVHGAVHLFAIHQLTGPALDSPLVFLRTLGGLDRGYRVMGYAFLLALSWTLEYSQRAQDSARRAAELETQARLDALRMQLHPHFLFNTLNSIAALLHVDVAAADRMIVRLGEFLRMTLDTDARSEVTIEDEMRFVRCYLGIQEVRFSDRLTTRVTVAPEVAHALVPNLILQPLVENAIRHGIQKQVGTGQITIRAERADGNVRLQVSDNGPGPTSAATPGIGLSNTAARLRTLYGEAHRFEAKGALGAGFHVTIEIPYRPAVVLASCAS